MLRCVRVVMQRCEFPLRAFVELGPLAIRFHEQLDSAVKSNVSRHAVSISFFGMGRFIGKSRVYQGLSKDCKTTHTREGERERERSSRQRIFDLPIHRAKLLLDPTGESIDHSTTSIFARTRSKGRGVDPKAITTSL